MMSQVINNSLMDGVQEKNAGDLVPLIGCVTLTLGFFSCLQLLSEVGVWFPYVSSSHSLLCSTRHRDTVRGCVSHLLISTHSHNRNASARMVRSRAWITQKNLLDRSMIGGTLSSSSSKARATKLVAWNLWFPLFMSVPVAGCPCDYCCTYRIGGVLSFH